MREQVLSDAQVFTNLDSTGGISTNTIDHEENAMVDDQIDCTLIATIIAATLTSGLTEGMLITLRNDDAAALTTARNGTSAGYKDAGIIDIRKEEIVAGRQFSCQCRLEKGQRYSGAWVRAVSTSLTGTVTLDIELHYGHVCNNALLQTKRTSV